MSHLHGPLYHCLNVVSTLFRHTTTIFEGGGKTNKRSFFAIFPACFLIRLLISANMSNFFLHFFSGTKHKAPLGGCRSTPPGPTPDRSAKSTAGRPAAARRDRRSTKFVLLFTRGPYTRAGPLRAAISARRPPRPLNKTGNFVDHRRPPHSPPPWSYSGGGGGSASARLVLAAGEGRPPAGGQGIAPPAGGAEACAAAAALSCSGEGYLTSETCQAPPAAP